MSDEEMLEGYLDGLRPECPSPSGNRSHCYRHGFANGRDDLLKAPRSTAQILREMADEARKRDMH